MDVVLLRKHDENRDSTSDHLFHKTYAAQIQAPERIYSAQEVCDRAGKPINGKK